MPRARSMLIAPRDQLRLFQAFPLQLTTRDNRPFLRFDQPLVTPWLLRSLASPCCDWRGEPSKSEARFEKHRWRAPVGAHRCIPAPIIFGELVQFTTLFRRARSPE